MAVLLYAYVAQVAEDSNHDAGLFIGQARPDA